MPKRGLRHLALRSKDLAATERFYVDVLGLEIAFPHKGMLFLQTPHGDDVLNFIETKKRFTPSAGGLHHFGLPRACERVAQGSGTAQARRRPCPRT